MSRVDLERMIENYRPNSQVLHRLGNLTLIMALGPSGAGKTTIMRASGLPMAIGEASRAPRNGEKNGIDYWFCAQADMIENMKRGEYFQVSMGVEGDLKATNAKSFPSSGVAAFAVYASAVGTFRNLGFQRTETAVIVPRSFEAWQGQFNNHKFDEDTTRARMHEAKYSLEFALNDPLSKFVLNDDLSAAVDRFLQVAAGQEPADTAEARAIAVTILEQLSIT